MDLLQTIPGPAATMVSPHLIAASGAFVAAATLGVLYLYRGRSFIVYWIGAWLLVGTALLLVSARYFPIRGSPPPSSA